MYYLPDSPFEIAIIGGGITGVTLAISLLARNIRCTIYEQAPQFREIGAGLGFGPNAQWAMRVCDERILDAVDRVGNTLGRDSNNGKGKDKEKATDDPIYFEFMDGMSPVSARELEPAFTVYAPLEGHRAVHRARFHDELVKMLPDGVVKFGKRLEEITILEDDDDEGVVMQFADGTTAKADAVVGCDGIKSRVREIVATLNDEGDVTCGYSGKFAYRCLIPMEQAVEELGEERCKVPSLWMGRDRHVLTYQVNEMLNLVAFVTDSDDTWPGGVANMKIPTTREDVLHDFEGFGQTVQRLIGITEANSKLERWGIFDHLAHPLRQFNHSLLLVIGDAAHASSPHHGSGAGFCMEDVAVLSSLLSDLISDRDLPYGGDDLVKAFACFDASQNMRDLWLVESSRRAADVYQWREEEFTRGPEDFDEIKRDVEECHAICWEVDVDQIVKGARESLKWHRESSRKREMLMAGLKMGNLKGECTCGHGHGGTEST
ncbi:hypothetical protein B0H63DRAFT_449328 [Podospora didyma]|uniref:FAD-binding domain-containing protein n=1 Tax=Podospora didyma TaxID=330526 RepID=A0AAE0NPP2_9PEZI|nr:hypothetical protein B0H63DRAFT_449328 [Podospora didyma]